MKWTRVRPGLYEATADTDIDGRRVRVTAWVCEQPEWPASDRWACEIWITGTHRYLTRFVDGPVATCRAAKAAAVDSIQRGWVTHPGLGLCGR